MKYRITLFTLTSLTLLAGCALGEPLVVEDAERGIAKTLNATVSAEGEEIILNVSESSEVVEDTNINVNSNTESDEVDTSDWLTYINEEYGFSFRYPASVAADESYTLTSNLNTPNTYALIQLSLETEYPSPIFSVNIAFNDLNTTVGQIMLPDVAASFSKNTAYLAEKDLTAISVTGSEGAVIIYAYQVDNKTILISVPDNSKYAEILDTMKFTK